MHIIQFKLQFYLDKTAGNENCNKATPSLIADEITGKKNASKIHKLKTEK